MNVTARLLAICQMSSLVFRRCAAIGVIRTQEVDAASHWGADDRQFRCHLNNIHRLQALRLEAVAGPGSAGDMGRGGKTATSTATASARSRPPSLLQYCRGAAEHSEPDLHCVAALDARR